MFAFLRQPFVQFLLGGAFLYSALVLFGPDGGGDDPYRIEVDDAALLTYLQFQDKAFDETQARQLLAGLDAESRTRLVEEYVRDEIMVREAIALGLDQNDDVIRQRLIQKVDFVFQGFADEDTAPSDSELTAFYTQNRERYQTPAQATFTHVFFNARNRDRSAAQSAAEALLVELNAQNIPFEAAGAYGDRFFFLRNYVERSDQLIRDHFGTEMADRIFAATPDNKWIGPFSSQYGEHLVMLRNRSDARILSLEEVLTQVAEDLMRERRDEARIRAYTERAKKYSVQTPQHTPQTVGQ